VISVCQGDKDSSIMGNKKSSSKGPTGENFRPSNRNSVITEGSFKARESSNNERRQKFDSFGDLNKFDVSTNPHVFAKKNKKNLKLDQNLDELWMITTESARNTEESEPNKAPNSKNFASKGLAKSKHPQQGHSSKKKVSIMADPSEKENLDENSSSVHRLSTNLKDRASLSNYKKYL
jgi:hypothetical protein